MKTSVVPNELGYVISAIDEVCECCDAPMTDPALYVDGIFAHLHCCFTLAQYYQTLAVQLWNETLVAIGSLEMRALRPTRSEKGTTMSESPRS